MCIYIPARSAILIRRDHSDLDSDRCAEKVNHLIVSEGGSGYLAYLHQTAAMAQTSLPGKAMVLHIRHQALQVQVEAQLAHTVPP